LKAQRLLPLFIIICVVLSLAITLASYYFYYEDLRIFDASFRYRGWPLYWMVESWSTWGRSPQYHIFQFQPLNFLIDNIFWAVVFQLPSTTMLLLRKHKAKQ